MTPQEFEAEVKRLGEYIDTRTLEDGTVVALGDLMFTRAIYFDCDLVGHSKRFCYEDRTRAVVEFYRLTDGDTYPTGWIATRPEPEDFYAKQN